MRRRLLLVAMWAAGTLLATAMVFVSVDRMSNSLFELGDLKPKPQIPKANANAVPPPITTTVVSAPEATTTTVAEETTTTVAEAVTTVTELDTVAPSVPSDTTPSRTSATTARTVVSVVTAEPTTPTAPRVDPPTTAAPPPVTNPPTTTTTAAPPPVTTAPSGTCQSGIRAVRRNTIFYRICGDGLHYANLVTVSGWSGNVVGKGPPSVEVVLTDGSTSIDCLLQVDGEGVVTATGC